MSGETQRDPRRTTYAKVQVRSDAGWTEATLCNVSLRGMMLRGEGLPARGSFVEIVGAGWPVAGQVRWAMAGRCGVRTSEVVDLAALVGEAAGGEMRVARKARPEGRQQSLSEREARSRATGRMLDFTLTLALLAGGAWLVFTTVSGELGRPLERIGSQLAPDRHGRTGAGEAAE